MCGRVGAVYCLSESSTVVIQWSSSQAMVKSGHVTFSLALLFLGPLELECRYKFKYGRNCHLFLSKSCEPRTVRRVHYC